MIDWSFGFQGGFIAGLVVGLVLVKIFDWHNKRQERRVKKLKSLYWGYLDKNWWQYYEKN